MNFVRTAMTKAFVNGAYKAWRQQHLYDREKALLPASQEVAKRVLECESINAELKEILYQRTAIRLQISTMLNKKMDELRPVFPHYPISVIEHRARAQIQPQIDDLSLQRIILDHKERVLLRKRNEILHPDPENETEPAERARFIRRCGDEDCKGFLSTQWKCGLCSKKTCPHCHVLKEEEGHECNPDDVETAKLLRADTAPCPSCATPIYKISGCDQMWCTQCNTAFSWTTRRIERGPIHNPHYFEYLRTRADRFPQRNPNDVICGRELNNDTIRGWSRGIYGLNPSMSYVLRIAQSVLHLRHDTLPRYRTDEVRNNEDLRVKFLLNRTTEDQFKAALYKRQKETDKKAEIYDILFMFVQTATEILFRITEDDHEALTLTEHAHPTGELNELAAYASRCLQDVSSTFGCVRYEIAPYDPTNGYTFGKYAAAPATIV